MPDNETFKALFGDGSLDYEGFIAAAEAAGIEPGDMKPEREKHAAALKSVKTHAALTEELSKTPAMDRGIIEKLIDNSAVTVGDDGEVNGLKEQLDALRRDSPYLFAGGVSGTAGVKTVSTGAAHGTMTDPELMSDEEYYRSIGL